MNSHSAAAVPGTASKSATINTATTKRRKVAATLLLLRSGRALRLHERPGPEPRLPQRPRPGLRLYECPNPGLRRYERARPGLSLSFLPSSPPSCDTETASYARQSPTKSTGCHRRQAYRPHRCAEPQLGESTGTTGSSSGSIDDVSRSAIDETAYIPAESVSGFAGRHILHALPRTRILRVPTRTTAGSALNAGWR